MSKKKRVSAASASGSVAAHHASMTAISAATGNHSAQTVLGASSASTTGHTNKKHAADPLDGLLQYYTSLAADVAPLVIDRTLWVHNMVLLVVQNVLMYDQHVCMEQLLHLLWTALWLGRACIATALATPFTSLRAENSRREVVLWRLVIVAIGLGAQGLLLYHYDSPQQNRHVQLLIQLLLMDVVSVGMFDQLEARLTWSQIVIAATETLFTTSIFSIMHNHKENLIYDRITFALTGLSATTHTFVLLTAKLIVFSPSSAREGAAKWSQQRGRELVAELRHSIDLHDDDESDAETHKQKKKKAPRSQPLHEPASQVTTAMTTSQTTCTPLSMTRSLLQQASVRVAVLMVGQALLLLLQVAASTHLMLSWEITSVLMLSSSHVLWTLLQLHEKLIKVTSATKP